MEQEVTELSESELKLLAQFLSSTRDDDMETIAQVLTTPDSEFSSSFGAGLADVLAQLSESVSATDREVIRLDDMRRSLQRLTLNSDGEDNLPVDAKINPKKLHQLSIQSELTSYYSQVGLLLEEFSTELVLSEVVDEDRRSKNIERAVKNKSQGEREWLLFATGVIDSGEKSNLRDTYRVRNNLVHESSYESLLNDESEFESEIIEAWNTVNLLHEKRFGLKMEHRISEILIGNGFDY